jgi:hypothetical protein
MADHRDGSATFIWPTTEESIGSWTIRVAAFDEGGGEDFHDFQIDVVPLCPGDCDGNGRVTVDELVVAVNIALGLEDFEVCANLDQDEDEAVSITELVSAARNGIEGCSSLVK